MYLVLSLPWAWYFIDRDFGLTIMYICKPYSVIPGEVDTIHAFLIMRKTNSNKV